MVVILASEGIVNWGYFTCVVGTEPKCRLWASTALLALRGPADLWRAVADLQSF